MLICTALFVPKRICASPGAVLRGAVSHLAHASPALPRKFMREVPHG